MLFGHVVEFEPAVLAVHDALGTQDVAVVAAVELVEHVLKSFLAELLRRLLAPGGEDVVGVVMMVMVALALGIVALLTVVVMVVMLVLVVLVMVMVVMMPMLVVMLILIVVMMVLVVVVVLVMFIVIVMMVMLMLVLGLFDLVLAAHLFKKLVAQRHLFDGGEDGLAVQLVPRSRQNGGVGVLLAQHRGGSLELFLRELLRAGKNDRAGGLDLVVVELTEVLHIDLDLAGVGHGDIAVELELGALVHRALHGNDDVGKLADAARLNEDAVGVELRHDLFERLVEVTDEGAADAARGHLGDLDAGLLQKAAVDVDLAEFVLDQHELFAAVGFRDQLFDERGLAGAQKAGENVNFRHKKYASFFFVDFQTYIISRICERFKSFSTQNAPFSRSQAHTGQRHTMI